MGVEYIHLGEECESRKASQREEIVWVGTTVLVSQVLCMRKQVERKKESLELVHPWRENSRACWSVLE
jgi:hypothetical protein